MKIKLLSCFLLIILVLSCGNSGNRLNSSKARKITLNDNHVRSYIKVTNELTTISGELPEKIQAQVPVDMSGYTDIITSNGFKNLQEFLNTGLVISICMNTIIQAGHMDDILAMTKEDYIAEYTEGFDDEDEFDRQFKEQMEEQLNETLSELESEGLVGQNTNYAGAFINKLKEKVGEKNTELVLKHFDELKSIWVLIY